MFLQVAVVVGLLLVEGVAAPSLGPRLEQGLHARESGVSQNLISWFANCRQTCMATYIPSAGFSHVGL